MNKLNDQVTFVCVGEKEVEFVDNTVLGDTVWKALLGFQFWKGREVGILHGGKVLQDVSVLLWWKNQFISVRSTKHCPKILLKGYS